MYFSKHPPIKNWCVSGSVGHFTRNNLEHIGVCVCVCVGGGDITKGAIDKIWRCARLFLLLARLFHNPQIMCGGGLRSRSATCYHFSFCFFVLKNLTTQQLGQWFSTCDSLIVFTINVVVCSKLVPYNELTGPIQRFFQNCEYWVSAALVPEH